MAIWATDPQLALPKDGYTRVPQSPGTQMQAVAGQREDAQGKVQVHAPARSRSQRDGHAHWGTKARAFGLSSLFPTISKPVSTAGYLEDLLRGVQRGVVEVVDCRNAAEL